MISQLSKILNKGQVNYCCFFYIRNSGYFWIENILIYYSRYLILCY